MLRFDDLNIDDAMIAGNENSLVINEISRKDIAIIGISVKLPLADTAGDFWNNIRNGADCTTKLPEDRRKDIAEYLRYVNNLEVYRPNFAEAAYLEDIDSFDYSFFHISPKEASLMDPNQRLFLEAAWNVIEDAGYGGKRLSGTNTGVYVGYASNLKDSYQKIIMDVEPSLLSASVIGNLHAIIPGRISYMLDLRGPTMVVDTACSSSIVAVHLACQGIRNGDCDMAIAGGIKINILPLDTDSVKLGVESSDYRTRAFDDTSEGFGVGEGVVAMMLKPLDMALNDGDNIYALIKGSAINQDGSSMGLTVTNPEAQSNVILKAWENAGIDPETIAYIETHGTGTKLGDPIEINGIKGAFSRYTDRKQFCAISSAKSNLGHLFECAGITGLLKAVMALKHREIPPTLYFNKPNLKIDFENSPVYINTRLRKWDKGNAPRRCGVSSFGLSGTNCHIVLEEAPCYERKANEDSKTLNMLALSADNDQALMQLVDSYRVFIEKNKDLNLGDVCYTANTGRSHYNYRMALIAKERGELHEKLNNVVKMGFCSNKVPGVYYGQYKAVSKERELKASDELTREEIINISGRVNVKIRDYLNSNKKSGEILSEICELYVKGGEIPWDELYKGEKNRRVSLPVYPFRKSRCWIDIPEAEEIKEKNYESEIYHTMLWRPEPVMSGSKAAIQGNVLIFNDDRGIGREIASKLRTLGLFVVEVGFSDKFGKIDEHNYTVGGNETDYNNLLKSMGSIQFSKIIHLMSITGGKEIEDLQELESSQKRGVYSLFYLTRALLADFKEDIEIILISEHVNEVDKSEAYLKPEGAPLFGLGKVVMQEYPEIACRCMDIDEHCNIDSVIDEIQSNSGVYMVAYRDNCRYVEVFDKIETNPEQVGIQLKENGVYLITGGMGGIGLEMAKYLASKCKVNLALVNRTKMPERETWEEILGKNEDVRICHKIKSIQEIEKSGSKVLCYNLDISDIGLSKNLIDDLKEKYGSLNGIIHSAGVPGNAFVIRRREDDFNEVLRPKIHGTWILDRLTCNEKLDFLVMFSSGLSVIGESGHGDYVASNSYLDSYAAYRNRKGRKTLTINWAAWKSVGTSVEYGYNVDRIFKAIPTEKALKAFDFALNSHMPRVIIGEFNYQEIYMDLIENLPFKLSEGIVLNMAKNKKDQKLKRKPVREKQFKEVKLAGKEGGEYTYIEMKLAQIYRDVLGFSEINIYDNFFEMGGDSILLTSVYKELEKEFPGKVKVADLFSYTTIYRLAQFIASKTDSKSVPEINEKENDLESELSSLFSEMENGNMTVEQVVNSLKEI